MSVSVVEEERLEVDHERYSQWSRETSEIRRATPDVRNSLLESKANATRRTVLEMIYEAGLGHLGGDFSVIDVLTVAYNLVLNINPSDPSAADRDRLILSKGHASASLYATLASCGFFPQSELSTFMAPLSPLNGHPNRNKVPGVEANTGPLGHGLPVGLGVAIGAKRLGRDLRVMVVVGDGELQEGSNWEALMSAAHFGVDNLMVIIDRNGLQQGASTEDTNRLEPLADKLAAFGWEVLTANGHDFGELSEAMTHRITGKPVVVIAKTVKGKGFSIAEGKAEWHHKVPNAQEFTVAMGELS